MTWTHKIANYVVICILEHIGIYEIRQVLGPGYCPHKHPGKARGTSFIFWGSVGYAKNICYFLRYFCMAIFALFHAKIMAISRKDIITSIDRFVKLTEVKPVENFAKNGVDFWLKMRYNKIMEMARQIAKAKPNPTLTK